jgi:hypothetical protein
MDMKHGTNTTGSAGALYPYYYWWLSEEGEAGKRLFHWVDVR